MALVSADVGFGRGIRTTPWSGDPASCISAFQALIGNASGIDGNVWSLTWRFKPRVANNGRSGTVLHTDINGVVRRWSTIVSIAAGLFRYQTFANNGAMLVALNDFSVGAADTSAHTFGWKLSTLTSEVYIDGVLANTVAGLGTLLAPQANDYIWVQGGTAPPTPNEEFDIGEIGYLTSLVDQAQFLRWHTDGVG